jgi:hypothetical protein
LDEAANYLDLLSMFQVLANLLSFVDSKAVATDFMVDEEEGFKEIAEAEKKVEPTKVIPKSPRRQTFSGSGFVLSYIKLTPTNTITLFAQCQ